MKREWWQRFNRWLSWRLKLALAATVSAIVIDFSSSSTWAIIAAWGFMILAIGLIAADKMLESRDQKSLRKIE